MEDKVEGVQRLYKRDLSLEMNQLKRELDKLDLNIYNLILPKRNISVKKYMDNYLRYHVANKSHLEVTLLEQYINTAPIEKSIDLCYEIIKIFGNTLNDDKKLKDFYEKYSKRDRLINPLEKDRINQSLAKAYITCDRIDNANKFLLAGFKPKLRFK